MCYLVGVKPVFVFYRLNYVVSVYRTDFIVSPAAVAVPPDELVNIYIARLNPWLYIFGTLERQTGRCDLQEGRVVTATGRCGGARESNIMPPRTVGFIKCSPMHAYPREPISWMQYLLLLLT